MLKATENFLRFIPTTMKTAPIKDDGYKIPRKTPPLPLVPVEKTEEETCTYKLLSNPTDANSSKYSFTMAVLDGTNDVRECIQFLKNMIRVFKGLGMGMNAGAEVEARANLTERMLRGTALAAFQKKYALMKAEGLNAAQVTALNGVAPRDITAGETVAEYEARCQAAITGATYDVQNDDLVAAIRAIIVAIAPNKALQTQKRWMRRHLRKTRDLNVRAFATHLSRINDEELPVLPPKFDDSQKLQEDEMIDILTSACPKSWSAEMDRQDFDPLSKGWEETVAFLARQEQANEHEAADDTKTVSASNKSNKKSRKDKGGSKSSSGLKFCHYHGENPTHDSNNCRTLKKMAESTKSGKSSGGKNKTWNRKAQENQDKTKKDLAAFIQKTIRKELNSFSKKKRKSDDVEEGELDAFDLAGFNYKDMGNLKISSDDDSDGSVSV